MITAFDHVLHLFLTGEMSLFLQLFFLLQLIAWTKRGMAYVAKKRTLNGQIHAFQKSDHSVLVLITVIDEDPDVWRGCLTRLFNNLSYHGQTYEILIACDGYNHAPEAARKLARIANEVCRLRTNTRLGKYKIFFSSACDKRTNLFMLYQQKTEHLDTVLLLDSDTFFESDDALQLLLRPFNDRNMGGTTTSQRIRNPRTWIPISFDGLEFLRSNWGSMLAANLYEKLLCQPGRAIGFRDLAFRKAIEQLPFCELKLFGKRYRRKAGDDRDLTRLITEEGWLSIIVIFSRASTTAPDRLRKACKTLERWARSSGLITVECAQKPMWWRYHTGPLLMGLSDIITAFVSVAMHVIALIMFFVGDDRMAWWQAVAIAYFGMMLTILAGSLPYYREQPRALLYLPLHTLFIQAVQYIKLFAWFTPWRIGSWGTREGADQYNPDADLQLAYES